MIGGWPVKFSNREAPPVSAMLRRRMAGFVRYDDGWRHDTPSGGEAVLVVAEGRAADRSALAAVRALWHAGFEPVVAYSDPPSLAAASRYAWATRRTRPPGSPGFTEEVWAVAAEVGCKTVLASSDASLLALEPHLRTLVDKVSLATGAEAVGLATPDSWSFPSGTELWAARGDLPYPVVVKPVFKLVGSPAYAAWDASELQAEGYPGPVVVQPYLRGPMFAIAGVMWRGELVTALQQRYVRTWPPRCGTSSWAMVQNLDVGLAEKLASLMAGHDGIFQAQFVEGCLIDLNPRVYGSMPLALAGGINLPAIVCRLRGGDSPQTPAPRSGATYRWLEGDIRALWAETRDGRLSWGEGLRELKRRADAYSVVSRDDPRPALTRVVHAVGRPLRRPR